MNSAKRLKSRSKSELRTGEAGDDSEFGVPEGKSEIAIRLKEAIRAAGGNQAVALRAGVPIGTVNNYVRGVNEPKAAVLGVLARACGVSLDWLVFSEELQPDGVSVPVPEPVLSPASVERLPKPISEREDFALLPRYEARAAAGNGHLAISEDVSDMLAFRRDWLRRMGINPATSFLLAADGDSMEPTIPDGALMLVDGSIREPRDIKNGAIYVIIKSGAVVVKRVQFRIDDSVVLISDNPIYERETISRSDMNDLHFAGRVVWIGRAI